VAPTLAALLGASIPASSQGRVLTEMLTLTQDQLAAVRAALQEQQSRLLDLYQLAIGQEASLEQVDDPVSAHQRALETARDARLNRERLPRALLALPVLLFPLALVWRKRGSGLAWLLGGAVLYVLLFNLRYALLDARTYSLSSVHSADELIMYCAITASLALLLSWLLASLASRWFRRRPREASELTLALMLLIVYLLALPVLWSYVLNRTLVIWTLPDMASMFLAFISLIQILIVGALGLLLAGVAALLAKVADVANTGTRTA
jgi:hypothetical protein